MFVFNFHFGNSLNSVLVPVRQPGEYTVVLSTDDEKYGGFGNVAKKTYATKRFDGRDYIELYIPARTGFGHAVFVRKYAVKQIDVCRKLCAFHRFLDF